MPDAVSIHATNTIRSADVVPIPRRYWWLKRIGAGTGVLLVLLGAMGWYWGWEADRRLQAEIDRIRAAGEPIFPEDFDPPEPVPDEDNAALALIRAANALTVPPDFELTIDDLRRYPNLIANRLENVQDLIEANERVLSLMTNAQSLKRIDWGIQIRSPALNLLLPSLAPQRSLVKFGYVAAVSHHYAGNDAAAIAAIRSVLHSSAVMDHQYFLISHMIAASGSSLAVEAIEIIAPELRVGDAGPGDPVVDQVLAKRSEVRSLIAVLLNPRSLQDGWVRAMRGERMLQFDTVLALIEGDLSFGALPGPRSLGPWRPLGTFFTFPIAPVLKLEALNMIQDAARQADAGTQPDLVAARRVFPAITRDSREFRGVTQVTRLLSIILQASLERTLELHFRIIAERRMAGAALAIRLYELDRSFRPATLSDLVPEYLEAVPLDPLAGDNREIGYLPDAPKPILYCVGLDGVDDGGEYAYGPVQKTRIDTNMKDLVFFLNGDRPRPKLPARLGGAGSAQTDEKGGNVEGEGGEDEEAGGGDEQPEEGQQ